jgi:hypothetical protein
MQNVKESVTSREFLAFTLGDDAYGIDILKVQEIRGYETVTKIVNIPAFIKGVINLRGIMVSVVDMRIKLQLFNVGLQPIHSRDRPELLWPGDRDGGGRVSDVFDTHAGRTHGYPSRYRTAHVFGGHGTG